MEKILKPIIIAVAFRVTLLLSGLATLALSVVGTTLALTALATQIAFMVGSVTGLLLVVLGLVIIILTVKRILHLKKNPMEVIPLIGDPVKIFELNIWVERFTIVIGVLAIVNAVIGVLGGVSGSAGGNFSDGAIASEEDIESDAGLLAFLEAIFSLLGGLAIFLFNPVVKKCMPK